MPTVQPVYGVYLYGKLNLYYYNTLYNDCRVIGTPIELYRRI